jgi:anti-sigma regulatory factor (Ser/Thr protein kinase)
MKEIALHILDIAENSIAAGAERVCVSVLVDEKKDRLRVRIEDNGSGVSRDELSKVDDPFYTSRATRRVGLGIPLLRQHAELSGGELKIKSEEGMGTRVEASFKLGHPDRQPLGDLEGSWLLLAGANPQIEWELNCSSAEGQFRISSSEIRLSLEVETIRGSELTSALKRMIRNNMEELGLVL